MCVCVYTYDLEAEAASTACETRSGQPTGGAAASGRHRTIIDGSRHVYMTLFCKIYSYPTVQPTRLQRE